MVTSALRMTLADMARFAGVSRPVATMWRHRPVAQHPFPEPVARMAGVDHFDAFQVADYLAATGRGNARVERADVAAHAHLAPVEGLDEEATFIGLTALLALAAVSGESLAGLTVDGLSRVAKQVDPADGFLLGEVTALGRHGPALAEHAEALADASFSAQAAFELLLRQHFARSLVGHAIADVRPEAGRLVGRLAAELASDSGWAMPLLVAPTLSVGDLLIQAARQYAGQLAPSIAVAGGDSTIGRLRRRRLAVHDLHWVGLERTAGGDLFLPSGEFDGSVHVMQLPAWGDAAATDVDVLDAVGDLVMQLDDNSRVVVLGPASALTDRPHSAEADRARDAVLRSGRLRAAVRLPAGLLVRAPRRHLALWVLGPAHQDVPVRERWTIVGDLSEAVLDDSSTTDLVTDVLASLTDPRRAATHAYRFAHRVLTATLIPGRAALVDPRRPGSTGRGRRSVEDLVTRRQCRLIPGNRVDPNDLTAEGRTVIGPEELIGSRQPGSRAVDPLTFAAAYPSSRYTEAGDVIFCTSPRPAAQVDREGGTVVLSPARTLRVVPDADEGVPDLVPEVIAADINASTGRDWRRWRIRLVPREQHAALQDELGRLDAERRDLQDRLTRLDEQIAQAMDHATTTEEEGR